MHKSYSLVRASIRVMDPADVAQNSIAPDSPPERTAYALTSHEVVGLRIASAKVVCRDVLDHNLDCGRSETT
jgi:hypothetical protein